MTPTEWLRELERLQFVLHRDEEHADLIRWAEAYASWGAWGGN